MSCTFGYKSAVACKKANNGSCELHTIDHSFEEFPELISPKKQYKPVDTAFGEKHLKRVHECVKALGMISTPYTVEELAAYDSTALEVQVLLKFVVGDYSFVE